MSFKYLLYSILLLACSLNAQQLTPSTEVYLEKFGNRSKTIVPGLMIYGVKWYSSYDIVVGEFGPPTGRVEFSDNVFALLYGKRHILIFEKNELKEVVIMLMGSTLNFSITGGSRILEHPFFDAKDISIEPGIKFGTTFDEIKKKLKGKIDHFDPAQSKDWKVTYVDEYAGVTLGVIQVYRPEGISNEIGAIDIRGN